jgi:HEAT repeat protein
MPLFKKSKAKQLAKSGDVSALIALITGPDPGKERADAALELPRFSQEIEAHYKDVAHAALTKAGLDPHREVRSSALFAWAELGWDDSLEHLIAGTDDSEWMVRVFAVTLLARFSDERAVTRLGEVLANDSMGMVREAAATSLGDLGDPGGLAPLRLAAETDSDREVRKAATAALKRLEGGSA